MDVGSEGQWFDGEQEDAGVTEGLRIEQADGICRLTIDRPASRNAMTTAVQNALVEALMAADADRAVSVIVLSGVGDAAFSAGVDLKEMAGLADGEWRGPYTQPTRSVWQALAETGKPTIAAVNGLAVGGGFELVLACDLVVAVRGVRVGLPEAKLGLAASFGSAQLSRRVPHGVACEMLFTGALRPIEELVQWGIVQRLAKREDLEKVTTELAESIARNAPLSLRRMKATMTKGQTLPLMAAVTLAAGPDPYTSQDRLEGVRAFREKRRPRWTGR
jgi:enoyl-CoA hydratase/carnithine racemase